MTTFKNRLEEFKKLNSKRNISKGFMQGLNYKEYNRIISLHSFLLSSKEGKKRT